MSASFPFDAQPHINWNHIAGPLLHLRNGEVHLLTREERRSCWLGYDNARSLEWKLAPRLVLNSWARKVIRWFWSF